MQSIRYILLAALCVAATADAAGGKGMTWTKRSHDSTLGIDSVNCNGGAPDGCNPYQGDMSCKAILPVLCVKNDGSPRPPYTATPSEFYDGWLGGHLSATLPIYGDALRSRATGDQLCSTSFGSGWRMAEFHDNPSGGWGFRGYGNLRSNQHFWVAINDQPGNCWNR